MTEEEWLACADWRPLLAFASRRWTLRNRKLYLSAGLRYIWDLLYDSGSRETVDLLERDAEGLASEEEIRWASWYAEVPTFGYDFDSEHVREEPAKYGGYSEGVQRLIEMGVYTEQDIQQVGRLGEEQVRTRLLNAAHIAYHSAPPWERVALGEHLLEHMTREKEWPGVWLVQEIVGNPFRLCVVDPGWRTPTVLSLAQAAYDKRQLPSGLLDAERLAILADALEDASCTNTEILSHLRGQGPHVRGCWVLDALLSKA
jgi:hypothetical protein